MDAPAAPAYTVPVRTLCAFAAKTGDLDLRFTPAPSAAEGIAGHRIVATRRGAAQQAEVTLEAAWRHLRVRGRADGVDLSRALVEEVKTHRGPVERVPEHHRALHRAQARIYGWLLAAAHALPRVTVRVLYFDVDRQTETAFDETLDAAELQAHFETLCGRFAAWADAELVHRAARDTALAALAWPHPGYRAGQRELATAVYNAARSGRPLLAQAPTGIGKTMATLFPVLKAMPGQRLDRVFFVSAKTPGRRLALDALATLQAGGARPLRVLQLVARDKACAEPGRACHGDDCRLARGFYDRLPAAREAALAALVPDGAALPAVAAAHAVCPYYLAQEMARWADVVVGDYNYVFDSGALLHALVQENGWRAVALVDEAHNLVPRAREMYSATLDVAAVRAAKRSAPAALKRPAERIARALAALAKAGDAPFEVADAAPDKLLDALRGYVSAAAELAVQAPAALAGDALQLHFDALRFAELAEALDAASSQFDLTRRPGLRGKPEAVACVRNIVPAPFLKPRLQALHTAVLFSATLAPAPYQRDLLGLPEGTAWLDCDSPFDAAQLQVNISRLSTRWADRQASLAPLAALIAGQYRERPGNYLAFFSSFDYLERAAAVLQAAAPELPLRCQQRRMGEAERQDFIASFTEDGRQIAFAVLGGAFGEGIDLPGTRLVGAFVATLGLPPVDAVQEAMKTRLDARFGTGWDYTYLVPGLQKVVQAAGRVIRTPEDRGVLHLVDDRFGRAEVRALLPGWWRVQRR
ncbi:ATP-dependent DNA helicase [Rubrivivax gelatinosus]|uniref:ATP-dependent DNA helicase n=1 Tax=Rubrivivax gelatinosus TaxID=28068 RepID=A0ABS1DQW8_RUBGE|nr:ATP-dependent DNA helicase [Rubrivivax gelatinosus]MBK1711878.1 ATP-dependent DNA helicase [Rubrivivax gelatinosus]